MLAERCPQGRKPLEPAHRKIHRHLTRLFIALSRPLTVSRGHVRPGAVKHVLFIRPDHLGDLLFLSPALDTWRRLAPDDVSATLSIGPWNESLARHLPPLDKLEIYPYPGFTRRPKGSLLKPYIELWQQARRVREGAYDLAVLLRFDHWWGGLLTHLAGVPLRLGYDTPPMDGLLNLSLAYVGIAHEVERNLLLVKQALRICVPDGKHLDMENGSADFTRLRYHVEPAEREAVYALLAELGVPTARPLVVLHVGAGAVVKCWPAERFSALADVLVETLDATILISGGPDERLLAEEVRSGMSYEAFVVAGHTDLSTLVALLEHSDLVIGADSGPLHLAVGVGTPSVHLYGPVDPRMFGPWTDRPDRHRVVQAGWDCVACNHLEYTPQELCQHRCMESISPEQVVDAARKALPAAKCNRLR